MRACESDQSFRTNGTNGIIRSRSATLPSQVDLVDIFINALLHGDTITLHLRGIQIAIDNSQLLNKTEWLHRCLFRLFGLHG